MLCVLISVVELSSEPTFSDCRELDSFVSTVDAEDSRMVACEAEGCGVVSSSGVCDCFVESMWSFERSCDADVESGSATAFEDGGGIGRSSGSSCCVSLIEMTIFSRSMGVMCFSRPLLLLLEESVRRSSGRASGMVVWRVADVSSVSSDTADSTLDESAGTGMSVVAAFGRAGNETRGGKVDRACDSGLQQNVSRFHKRHDRFSNRLPSSMACDVLENKDHCEVLV